MIESAGCRYEIVESPVNYAYAAAVEVPYGKGGDLDYSRAKIVKFTDGAGTWSSVVRWCVAESNRTLRNVWKDAKAASDEVDHEERAERAAGVAPGKAERLAKAKATDADKVWKAKLADRARAASKKNGTSFKVEMARLTTPPAADVPGRTECPVMRDEFRENAQPVERLSGARASRT